MNAPSFTATVGTPQPIITPALRQSWGINALYDTSASAWFNDGMWHFFGAGDAGKSDGGVIHLVAPDLNTPPAPQAIVGGRAVPALQKGSIQPSPDGGDFDRDYAGGGSVWYDKATGLLHLTYHGEYHWQQGPSGLYASIGHAVSSDRGRTFQKTGQIIRPTQPRDEINPVTCSAGCIVPFKGALLLYYMDTDFNIAANPFPAVAQRQSDGTWLKWYNGSFAQTGIGGMFTPLFAPPHVEWCRWPWVWLNTATGHLLMAYGSPAGLMLRESVDGLVWSDRVNLLPTPPNAPLNYVGAPIDAAGDLHHVGNSFYLHFLSGFLGDSSMWQTATWKRAQVTLS